MKSKYFRVQVWTKGCPLAKDSRPVVEYEVSFQSISSFLEIIDLSLFEVRIIGSKNGD